MRALPAGLYFRQEGVDTFLERVHEISAITHAHPRSKIACGIYCLLVRELLRGTDKNQAFASAVKTAQAYYDAHADFRGELTHFARILSLQLPHASVDDISSSGYVVDTLEASIWCFLSFQTTRDILLSAVNLGLDTDTTGMVAGGLAGLYHGLETVPEPWRLSLARREEIDVLITSFADTAAARRTA
jgi:ADP-ribosylglycohydrolase